MIKKNFQRSKFPECYYSWCGEHTSLVQPRYNAADKEKKWKGEGQRERAERKGDNKKTVKQSTRYSDTSIATEEWRRWRDLQRCEASRGDKLRNESIIQKSLVMNISLLLGLLI